MKTRLTALLTFFVMTLAVHAADSYRLVSKDGRSIEITDPQFDGETLKARRADGYPIALKPEQLDPDSWAQLQADVTAGMDVTLKIERDATKKRDPFAPLESIATAKVIFPQAWSKEIYLRVYLFKPNAILSGGDSFTISESRPIEVPVDFDFQTAASYPKDLHLPQTATAVVAVAEHADGTVSSIWSDNRVAEDWVREFYKTKSQTAGR